MNSIKLIADLKNNSEFKLLYDIVKKPVELGGFDIENVYVIETLFDKKGEYLQGKIKVEKNDSFFEVLLNKVECINIYDYRELKNVTISIENGESDLVFLVKIAKDIVIDIKFNSGEININNKKLIFDLF